MQKTEDIVWDLNELYDSVTTDCQPLLNSIDESANDFVEKYKGNVANLSSVELHQALKAMERLKSQFYQLSQFAHLNYSVDIQNTDVLKFVAKVDEFGSLLSNKVMFFFLEAGAVSDDCVDKWLSDSLNTNYDYLIRQTVKRNRYRLTEKEEQMINLKDLNGVDALKKLYGEHTSRYQFKLIIDGEEKTMNGTECRALRYHNDPKVRREAMALFFDRYKQDEHIMTHLFNTIIKDFNVERSQRGYQSPIETMNINNDLPNELVDMLHDVTSKSNKLVQRYYGLKKSILGLDRMTLADIYAPMNDDLPLVDWESAKQIVLESFQAFDSDFYEFTKDMIDRNRMHVFPSKVKRGGAFCSSSHPNVRPFVMLNHLGKQRDVATLAHELGHAIHAYFSSKQTLFNYHAILPICETASVFCEMLVIDELKKRATSPNELMILLTTKLEDVFATSHRQNMFSRFEQVVHKKVMDGRISGAELCEIYRNELAEMFGDSVEITDEYHWEWSSIPHMLDVPFYVYSYNFGNLLVLGLYQLYLDEGESFIPKLKRILMAGSSKPPVQLLADEGIDILSESFWQGSINYISSIIDELETVVSKL